MSDYMRKVFYVRKRQTAACNGTKKSSSERVGSRAEKTGINADDFFGHTGFTGGMSGMCRLLHRQRVAVFLLRMGHF